MHIDNRLLSSHLGASTRQVMAPQHRPVTSTEPKPSSMSSVGAGVDVAAAAFRSGPGLVGGEWEEGILLAFRGRHAVVWSAGRKTCAQCCLPIANGSAGAATDRASVTLSATEKDAGLLATTLARPVVCKGLDQISSKEESGWDNTTGPQQTRTFKSDEPLPAAHSS